MRTAEWTKVVYIEIAGDKREYVRISNTREAARCLLEKWPAKDSRSYKHAVVGCSRALKGYISDDMARLFLVEAAKAAKFPYVVNPRVTNFEKFEMEIGDVARQLIAAEQVLSQSRN
jgi:hypothetical protein